eukprot:scaffold1237_cov29-Tisochrysis_lutea.AAC.3
MATPANRQVRARGAEGEQATAQSARVPRASDDHAEIMHIPPPMPMPDNTTETRPSPARKKDHDEFC